jgi:membrane protein YdbS with pleckstrin-like domain
MLLAFVWPWVLLSLIPDVPAWTAIPLAAAALVVSLVAIALVNAWVSSIQYDVRESDLLVRKGIFVQSLKMVPFRTVTNIARKRDVLDRWFFRIGSVHVETAGHSGATGAEAVLEGLDDWDGVYDRIMQAVLAYRGRAMDATGAGEEPSAETPVASSAVLTELQAIRRLLDERLPRN